VGTHNAIGGDTPPAEFCTWKIIDNKL